MADIKAGILQAKETSPEILHKVFAVAAHPVNFVSAMALKAMDKDGTTLLTVPGGVAATVTKAGNHLIYKQYEPSSLPDGRHGYRLTDYRLEPLEHNQWKIENLTLEAGRGMNAIYVAIDKNRPALALVRQRKNDRSQEDFVIGNPSAIRLDIPKDGVYGLPAAAISALTGRA